MLINIISTLNQIIDEYVIKIVGNQARQLKHICQFYIKIEVVRKANKTFFLN